jgi:hypothetical protein
MGLKPYGRWTNNASKELFQRVNAWLDKHFGKECISLALSESGLTATIQMLILCFMHSMLVLLLIMELNFLLPDLENRNVGNLHLFSVMQKMLV